MQYPPLQERSKQTLDRIMDAAEALLEEKVWGDITIQEIVTSAGSSVGSFYARFENKEALLEGVSRRFSDHVKREAERINELTSDLTIQQYIEVAVKELIRFHYQRRGIIRALTLIPRHDRSTRFQADGLQNADIFISIAERLSRLCHDADRARLGLFVVSVSIREAVVFPEISQSLVMTDHTRMAEEMSQLLIAYLES